MKPIHTLTALTALLTLTIAIQPVYSQSKLSSLFKKENTKKQLIQENQSLKSTLDSLKLVIEELQKEPEPEPEESTVLEMKEIIKEIEGVSVQGLRTQDYNTEVTDSLLHLWFAINSNKLLLDEVDMDSTDFSSDVPDQVFIDRINAIHSFIPLPYNDVVRKYIIMYAEKRKTYMGRLLGLCKYYLPIFEETFVNHGIPEELKALAIIESALNPNAVSRAGATGMWQFMYKAATQYGLTIDSYVDERRDPYKSVEAAAKYLKDAYAVFGDWNLAISSYNCGPGNVQKAIRRSGGKRDYWDIYPYLPRETRGYVPAFVAVLYTFAYYKEHGIVPAEASMPVHVDTLKINKMLHFKQINEVAGVPMDIIQKLNPQYVHDIIPGAKKEYLLRLPYSYVSSFIDNADSIYRYHADSLFSQSAMKKVEEGATGEKVTYIVKNGDNLGAIAKRHRTTVTAIKKWNGLKSDMIRAGQKLTIYRGKR